VCVKKKNKRVKSKDLAMQNSIRTGYFLHTIVKNTFTNAAIKKHAVESVPLCIYQMY